MTPHKGYGAIAPRGSDRRSGPRREPERNLHYATVNLLAAALAWADGDGYNTSGEDHALLQAVATYRTAEAALRPTPLEVVPDGQ